MGLVIVEDTASIRSNDSDIAVNKTMGHFYAPPHMIRMNMSRLSDFFVIYVIP